MGQNGRVLAGRLVRVWRSVGKGRSKLAAGLLLTALVAGGWGCSGQAKNGADPAIARARAAVDRAQSSVESYRGPASGPRAQPGGLIVFVAADLTNGGIAGVARGVQEATRAIGWRLQIEDGQASADGQRRALDAALRLKPAGVILGGFDAAGQAAALKQAKSLGIPVVGWHSGTQPGPEPRNGLFTNVTTDPAQVARLAAQYAIADSGGTAAAVIFYDSEYAIAKYKADLMASELKTCRRCRVLTTVDQPIASAQVGMPPLVTSLLQRFGKRFGYLLAINGAYITGARIGLFGAGRAGDQPPYSIAAGDGDATEFARIRASDYQKASVAEPLYLQGWQLIDELNRARAGRPPSGYVAPPRLITEDDVPNGPVFDPASGYRENYRRIWRR